MACQGKASVDDTAPNNGQTTTPTTTGSEEVPDPFPDLPCAGVACDDPVPSVTPRVTRLTHHQWENTVRDLLRLEQRTGLSATFLQDTLGNGHFDRLAGNLSVPPNLWDDYREAAETLAAQTTSDPAALSRIEAPDAPTDLAERSRLFIEHFGERAYRRPLTTTEVDSYIALMEKAPQVFGDGAAFERAAELAIRAFLQSPHFLYRVETHTVEGEDIVPLDAYERAARLSYALWNTMPDATLLAAAEAGGLDRADTLVQEVERMLDDDRARDVIADFHAQLLGFEHFQEMSKAEELFPEYTEETPEKLERELEMFIDDVVFSSDGTYRTLMTARHTFIDADGASIYGVSAPASDFGRVELGDDRPGMLTRAGFLALNATAYDPNPIHRGVFIDERMLCMQLPPPPEDFSIPDGVEGNTNRERIDNATRECGGACHVTLINPPGFAFEHFDALGAYRANDGDYPVDASGSLVFDGVEKSWDGAAGLVNHLAESEQAHTCYVRNWFEYVNGRLPAAGDEPLIARLGQVSFEGDATIKEILAAMVTSSVFLNRDTRGEP